MFADKAAGLVAAGADVIAMEMMRDGDYSLWATEAAMATGLPVVATAVGGNSEVVSAETTGVLVPPDNAIALADAVLRLVASPGLRARLGAAARRHVEERYGARAMVRRLEAVYAAVADGIAADAAAPCAVKMANDSEVCR